MGTSIYARQDIRNYAFFGNGEYDILPALTFKAGVRYTNSRNNADNCTGDIGDGSAAAYVNFLASLSGKPFVPIGSSGPLNQRCASLNARSEEHTSELQSLMRISYAVFCLKKTTHKSKQHTH